MRVPRNALFQEKKVWHSMRKWKKRIPYIIGFVITAILFGFFIYIIDPGQMLTFGTFSISPVIVFFILFSLVLFCAVTSILLNTRRGFLVTFFVDGVLALRYFGIKNWFNVVILFLIVALIETFFIYKPHKPKLPKEKKVEE